MRPISCRSAALRAGNLPLTRCVSGAGTGYQTVMPTLTRNNLIGATLGTGALVLCLLWAALFAPFDLRAMWKDVKQTKIPINDEGALFDTAYGHFNAKDDLIARDVTRRLLKVSPKSARGHKLMAALHLRDENFAAALTESRIASGLDPADPMAQMAIAESLRGLGDRDGARTAFEKAARNPLTPDSVRDKALSGVEAVSRPAKPASAQTPDKRIEKKN